VLWLDDPGPPTDTGRGKEFVRVEYVLICDRPHALQILDGKFEVPEKNRVFKPLDLSEIFEPFRISEITPCFEVTPARP
jgi:hypothetical protein